MRFALSLVFVLCASAAAGAATVTFDDEALFLATSGATSATGALPSFGASGVFSTTIGDVTYSGSQQMYFDDHTPLLVGNEMVISGPESFNLDLVAPVYALGFQWSDSDPADGSFVMTLRSGGAVVDSFGFAASAANSLSFFGVTSDAVFDRVEITETQLANENEVFGEIYTAESAPQVPEPTTWALLALIGAALGRCRRP